MPNYFPLQFNNPSNNSTCGSFKNIINYNIVKPPEMISKKNCHSNYTQEIIPDLLNLHFSNCSLSGTGPLLAVCFFISFASFVCWVAYLFILEKVKLIFLCMNLLLLFLLFSSILLFFNVFTLSFITLRLYIFCNLFFW